MTHFPWYVHWRRGIMVHGRVRVTSSCFAGCCKNIDCEAKLWATLTNDTGAVGRKPLHSLDKVSVFHHVTVNNGAPVRSSRVVVGAWHQARLRRYQPVKRLMFALDMCGRSSCGGRWPSGGGPRSS